MYTGLEARRGSYAWGAEEDPDMTELVFIVEDDPEGGYNARAAEAGIFTQGDTLEALRENARDTVTCHLENPEERPKLLRLHYVRDEVIAV